jgi:hypothetical protein
MTLITEDITEDNPKASWVIATALEKVGIPELLPHLSEILLTTSLYEPPYMKVKAGIPMIGVVLVVYLV